MAGRQSFAHKPAHVSIIGHPRRISSRMVAAAVLAVGLFLTSALFATDPATADHLMCGLPVDKRVQTVWIDPDLAGTGVTRADVLAAFEPWNALFLKYHGLQVFQEHAGPPAGADVIVSRSKSGFTWVETACSQGFVKRGTAHATVWLGVRDAWRNRQMLAHELGHALGLADHGMPAQQTEGHAGFRLCDNTYLGVMSYCSGYQLWFLDKVLPGIRVDADVVRAYWQH